MSQPAPLPYPPARELRKVPRRIPVVLRLALFLLALTLAGALLFMLPGISYRPLNFGEAMFTSASALTVTGLMTYVPAATLTPAGQVLLIILAQIGGMGLMVLTALIFRLFGRQINLMDRLALRNSLGNVMPGAVLNLVWRIVLGVLIIEGTGTLLLWLHWRSRLVEPLGGDLPVMGYALFHSISAFTNAGFDLFTGSSIFPSGIPQDAGTLTIFSGLIILGGLGVPVIADLLTLTRGSKLSLHSRITLPIIALLILIGGAGIFLAEILSASPAGQADWLNRLGLSFFQAISARSGGFSGVPGFDLLTPASQFLLVLLMFIGAAPASMGGGITTGTAAVLALAVSAYVRNRTYPVVGGRAIAGETVRRATAVLIAALLVVSIATWLLLVTHPGVSMISALFEVVSAFATCGLTLAFTPQLNGFGQAVVMFVMFWGRLGALSVVIALTRPAVQPLVQYPEEQILIG